MEQSLVATRMASRRISADNSAYLAKHERIAITVADRVDQQFEGGETPKPDILEGAKDAFDRS